MQSAKCVANLKRLQGRRKPWTEALASHAGNVRERNEDAGVAFRVARYQVAMVADGMGGLPQGAEASSAAIEAAQKAIKRLLLDRARSNLGIEVVIEMAFEAAERFLQWKAAELNPENPSEGFRTTLIIVIGTDKQWFVGWIGDGGCSLVKASVTIPTMNPHKNPKIPWLLHASLGPSRHGSWSGATFPRHPEDVVIVGTDGLFDGPLPLDWETDIIIAASHNNGDLQAVADRLVRELAEAKDTHGFLFSDNITVALIGGGVCPVRRLNQ